MSFPIRTILLALLGLVPTLTTLSWGQPAATAPQASSEAKSEKGDLSGQEDFEKAMDLKVDAKDIEKNSVVIDLLEQAIKKGLAPEDEELAKQLLASAAFDRAKLQLQETIRARVSEALAKRVQQKVLQDLEIAITNDPTLGEAYLLIARLTASTAPNKARAALDKAIENLANDREKRGEAYAVRAILQSDFDAKIDDLKQAVQDVPENVEIQRTLFAILNERGRHEESYQLGKKLLDENAKNPIALRATVSALLELERQEEALSLLGERIADDATDVDLLMLRGNVFLATQRYDEAIADATKMIELKEDAFEGYLLRCNAFLARAETKKEGSDSEDLKLARRDVESALDINNRSIAGIELRAAVASQQKKYDEAIQDMTLLAKNEPQNPKWLGNLARLYLLDDRPSLAVKIADQLILMDSRNWRAYRIRGDANLSIGDQAVAVKDYRKALEIQDKSDVERSELLNNLAWLLATATDDSLRDGPLSIRYGTEACELTEYQAPHILSTLAAGYAETGDFETAIKWSTKAVELGAEGDHEQLEQLKNELQSYKEGKPWREKQEVKEKKPPIIKPEDTIET